MTEAMKWRADGVKVVRADALELRKLSRSPKPS